MNDFDIVSVEFAGKRKVNYRVRVYVDGNQYNGQGYVFGPKIAQRMSRVEAKVLTGETKPHVLDDGKVVTGFVVNGDLGCDGLAGEAYKMSEVENGAVDPCAEKPVAATETATAESSRRVTKRPIDG